MIYALSSNIHLGCYILSLVFAKKKKRKKEEKNLQSV